MTVENARRIRGFAVPKGYDRGTSKDGPERGVGTSGRGLADWIGVD